MSYPKASDSEDSTDISDEEDASSTQSTSSTQNKKRAKNTKIRANWVPSLFLLSAHEIIKMITQLQNLLKQASSTSARQLLKARGKTVTIQYANSILSFLDMGIPGDLADYFDVLPEILKNDWICDKNVFLDNICSVIPKFWTSIDTSYYTCISQLYYSDITLQDFEENNGILVGAYLIGDTRCYSSNMQLPDNGCVLTSDNPISRAFDEINTTPYAAYAMWGNHTQLANTLFEIHGSEQWHEVRQEIIDEVFWTNRAYLWRAYSIGLGDVSKRKQLDIITGDASRREIIRVLGKECITPNLLFEMLNMITEIADELSEYAKFCNWVIKNYSISLTLPIIIMFCHLGIHIDEIILDQITDKYPCFIWYIYLLSDSTTQRYCLDKLTNGQIELKRKQISKLMTAVKYWNKSRLDLFNSSRSDGITKRELEQMHDQTYGLYEYYAAVAKYSKRYDDVFVQKNEKDNG